MLDNEKLFNLGKKARKDFARSIERRYRSFSGGDQKRQGVKIYVNPHERGQIIEAAVAAARSVAILHAKDYRLTAPLAEQAAKATVAACIAAIDVINCKTTSVRSRL